MRIMAEAELYLAYQHPLNVFGGSRTDDEEEYGNDLEDLFFPEEGDPNH
jgi:hypothetical protein